MARRRGGKHRDIATRIRQRIVAGEYLPGQRLPTLREFVAEFDVTHATVHRALKDLREGGFIYTKGRAGTFVTSQPPHLANFAVLLPPAAVTELPEITERLRRLCEEAAEDGNHLHRDGRRWACYRCDADPGEADSLNCLLHAIDEQRVAGLILVCRQAWVPELQAHPQLPPVALLDTAVDPELALPQLRIDLESLLELGCRHLFERGCRKLAVIWRPQFQVVHERVLERLIAKHGLHSELFWRQAVLPGEATSVRRLVHLLMNPNQQARPDGLLVLESALLPDVAAGLADAGREAPLGMRLVCRCWWPAPALPCVEPSEQAACCPEGVVCMGHDLAEALAECTRIMAPPGACHSRRLPARLITTGCPAARPLPPGPANPAPEADTELAAE